MAYKQGAYTFVFMWGGGGGLITTLKKGFQNKIHSSAGQHPFLINSLLNLQNVIKNQIHFNTSWRLEGSL